MTTVSGSIFMTENAHNVAQFAYSYPSKPQDVIKVHMEATLDHHNYSHDITVSTDYSFDTDNHDDTDSDLVELRDFHWRAGWLEGHTDASEHFNLLLLNKDEWPNPDGAKGVSTHCDHDDDTYPRGGVLLNGVKAGDHDTTADRYGASGDTVEGVIRGCIHENGHQIGMGHEQGLRYEEFYPSLNKTITYATPMGCDAGATNLCDTLCASSGTDKWDHYYGDCEVSDLCL